MNGPEGCELQNAVAFVIESVVLSPRKDAKEEEEAEAQSPHSHQNGTGERNDAVPCLSHNEGEKSQDDKVASSGKVCDFVEFCKGCDDKEEELIADGDDSC